MIRALLSHNPVLIFSKILSPMFIDQSSKNTEKPASIKSVAMALEKAKSTEEWDIKSIGNKKGKVVILFNPQTQTYELPAGFEKFSTNAEQLWKYFNKITDSKQKQVD